MFDEYRLQQSEADPRGPVAVARVVVLRIRVLEANLPAAVHGVALLLEHVGREAEAEPAAERSARGQVCTIDFEPVVTAGRVYAVLVIREQDP